MREWGDFMTIKEIAELAGVSRATVSRYLNDGYVSEEKKKILKKVIEENSYVPSTQAQTLRTKRTGTIGVIIPRVNSEAIGGMIDGISDSIAESGYRLMLANTANNEKNEIKYLRAFNENFVDGVILIGTVITGEHKRLVSEMNVPVVVLAQKIEGVSCVYHDDFNSVKALTARMLKKTDKIGYIGVTERDKAAGLSRKNGYKTALGSKGIKYDENYIVKSDFSIEGGYRACKELIEKAPEVRGIICATDNIAVGAVKLLKDRGIAIPDQIMVAGVGGNIFGEMIEPSLTTVRYYYDACGSEAGRLLVDMIKGKTKARREIKMGYEIIVRNSAVI